MALQGLELLVHEFFVLVEHAHLLLHVLEVELQLLHLVLSLPDLGHQLCVVRGTQDVVGCYLLVDVLEYRQLGMLPEDSILQLLHRVLHLSQLGGQLVYFMSLVSDFINDGIH
jgi:hypothetical protein